MTTIAPQPPGPGLPFAAPSVKRMIGKTSHYRSIGDSDFTAGARTAAAKLLWPSVATFAVAVSAGPEVAPTYLRLNDTSSGKGQAVVAIYTPFVWANVVKSGKNDENIVRIARRRA